MSRKAIPVVILILIITCALGIAGGIVSSGQYAPSHVLMDPLTSSPSLNLLSAGTRWAAGNGSLALFVNWKDNWLAHHLTDGSSWGPWPSESGMDNSRFSVYYALSQSGLNVEFAGDIPENLSRYDVVIVEAYWAVEPKHEPLFRNYVLDGGGVVLLGGVPTYFGGYCKDWWGYRLGLEDLNPIREWFGAGFYHCADGFANITVDNPFDLPMLKGDVIFEATFEEAGDNAAVTSLNDDAKIIAQWQNQRAERRGTFALTHEYGQGRVYYQAAFPPILR